MSEQTKKSWDKVNNLASLITIFLSPLVFANFLMSIDVVKTDDLPTIMHINLYSYPVVFIVFFLIEAIIANVFAKLIYYISCFKFKTWRMVTIIIASMISAYITIFNIEWMFNINYSAESNVSGFGYLWKTIFPFIVALALAFSFLLEWTKGKVDKDDYDNIMGVHLLSYILIYIMFLNK